MNTATYTRFLRKAALVLALLVAGTAFAQVAPSAGVGTTGPNTTTVVTDGTAGTVVNGVSRVSPGATSTPLVTVQLTSTQNRPVQLSSLPLTFTFSGGASPSNLSSCQLVNANGTVLNSGVNTLNGLVNGSNTIVLDAPLVVSPGTVQNLSLRCNVSSSTPTGGTFQVSVNPSATIFSLTPALAVTSTSLPAIQNNTVPVNGVSLGTVRLDAGQSGSDIRISSIPVLASTLGSATPASVSGCQLVDSAGFALNSGANVSGPLGATTNIILNTPLTVPAGSATTLTLRCNVAPGTGGTLVLLPGAGVFSATSATTGASVTPSITTLAGTPFALGGAVVPTVPGAPGTGLGDKTAELSVAALLAAALLAAGLLYTRRRQLSA